MKTCQHYMQPGAYHTKDIIAAGKRKGSKPASQPPRWQLWRLMTVLQTLRAPKGPHSRHLKWQSQADMTEIQVS